MIRNLLLTCLMLALAACASAPRPTLSPEGENRERTIASFPSNFTVAETFQVVDATDARQLVLFALELEGKLKFAEAATFFKEAADLQEKGAPAGRFRLSCLGAAAVCWLKAGEEELFHAAVSDIRKDLDRFQHADLENRLSVLLAISDKLKGKSVRLNPTLPQTVKTLFGQPRRIP